MSLKAFLLILPLLVWGGVAFSQPPEELLTVGIGAFEDGFWRVAETQWRRFLRLYPNHPQAAKVRYMLARTLIQQDRFQEAEKLLRQVLLQDQTAQPEVNYWLGFCLARLGRWEEVEPLLQKALKAEGLRPSALVLLAEAYCRLERFGKAVALLREAIPLLKERQRSRARLLLGISLYKDGKTSEAIKALKGVNGVLAAEALYWRAEAELKAGRPQEALKTFRELLQRYPRSSHLAEARYGLASALLELGKTAEARNILTSWLKTFSGHSEEGKVRLLLGRVLMKEGRFEEALTVLKEVAKGQGEEAREAHYRLVWCYLHMGKIEEARRLLGQYENDISHYLRAEVALWEGDCEEALPYLFELMNKKAFRKKALLEIARCSYRLEKYRDCIANLDILKLEFPDFEKIDELLWLKAECLRGVGEGEEATKFYRLIIEKHPTSERVAWALFRLLDRAVKGGKLKEADGYFRQLRDSFPEHELTARGGLLLGKALVIDGRWKEAIPKLQRAKGSPIKEVKGRALCWLGKAYMRLGSLGEAMRCFEEATQQGGEMAVIAYVEMGNIMAELGDSEGAIKAYQKALKLVKDEKLRSHIKELLDLATEEAG